MDIKMTLPCCLAGLSNNYLVFFRTPFFLPLLYPKLIWRILSDQNKIYLTFDDGPVPGPTEFTLEQLKKFNAKATFFCIGNNVVKHSSLFDQIKSHGHAVGNHTFNHIKGWNSTDDIYNKDIAECQQVIGGTQLFRPPFGRIKRSQVQQLQHFRIIMWDVLSHDYSKSISKNRCLSGAIRATRPGSIVVFHDSYKAEKKMTHALPRFLEHFSEKGFVFDSLTEV